MSSQFAMTAPYDLNIGDRVGGIGLEMSDLYPGDEKDWVGVFAADLMEYRPRWPLSQFERARLALLHEPEASSSPDGFRLATCVVCEKPMVAMWHLWVDAGGIKKEIHMCHVCATDVYGAPTPDAIPVIRTGVIQHGDG